MSTNPTKSPCAWTEQVALRALGALPLQEQAAVEAHILSCSHCREESDALGAVTETFVSWPTDVLRAPTPLWQRIADRIATESPSASSLAGSAERLETEWEPVAPGIECQVLSIDPEAGTVSMLVRLQPGAEYPPHTHAMVEELYLLDGELWIDDRKLYPGDYNRAEPGTADKRVWTETGCTCVLITSVRDRLA